MRGNRIQACRTELGSDQTEKVKGAGQRKERGNWVNERGSKGNKLDEVPSQMRSEGMGRGRKKGEVDNDRGKGSSINSVHL